MKCPDDGSQLQKRHYEATVEIDECPSCHGVWLDAGELEKIQESKERDHEEALSRPPDYAIRAHRAARQKQEGKRRCSHCGREMESREYAYCSQIVIDVCPECRGIWLDVGELQALEVFFERQTSKSFLKSLMSLFSR